jgi:hypothetical protein
MTSESVGRFAAWFSLNFCLFKPKLGDIIPFREANSKRPNITCGAVGARHLQRVKCLATDCHRTWDKTRTLASTDI